MVIGLKLALVFVGLLVWMLPTGRFSEAGKWTFIVALAAWLFGH